MTSDRRLEFHDSTVVAVQRDANRAVIELDGYFRRWEGSGASRRGSAWSHRVRLELDFSAVEGQLTTLPVELSDGRVISKHQLDEAGVVPVPISIDRAVVLELIATSGERLRISARRLRARALGKSRYLEGLPSEMDPERKAP